MRRGKNRKRRGELSRHPEERNHNNKDIYLSDLKKGDKAEIISNESTGQIRRRLLDMGAIKGTSLLVIRKAPLGDPVEIEINGFLLTLRLEEASHIKVRYIS